MAVDNLDIKIKQGELAGLVGLNGAGKTTLIKLLCCLTLPTNGTAKVAGYDIIKDEERVKALVGLVSGEERNFYWRLTGRQNLSFFAALYKLTSQKIKEKIKELSSLLKIDNELDKKFYSYSAGARQKLAIIRSLMHSPQVLFMDEPFKSLDYITAKNMRLFIKEHLVARQNITIIFTSHNPEELKNFASRLLIMDKGAIKAYGTIDELQQKITDINAAI